MNFLKAKLRINDPQNKRTRTLKCTRLFLEALTWSVQNLPVSFLITWVWGLVISKMVVYIFVYPMAPGWHQGAWGTKAKPVTLFRAVQDPAIFLG